jgi:ribosome biogenesis GTPase
MKNLGFTNKIQKLIPSDINDYELARIIVEHKERYIIQSTEGTYHAEITGNLKYSASSRSDFPAVGDWVRHTKMDEKNAIILEVFPRYSVLERQAVGKHGEIQLIATNIDCAFLVQAVGHDFNLKRLERYLSLCYSSNIEPIIVLTKIDLVGENEVKSLFTQITERFPKVPALAISSETNVGYAQLASYLEAFKTYCFIGSSGVGKSTIINHLKNEEVLKINEISSSTNKGKHTTSHRELFVLPNKSIVIDTPGMREVGITEQIQGIEITYNEIVELAQLCKYSDCTHTNEAGCAVLEAIEDGRLLEEVYQNYQKLKREQEHFSSTVHEKRQKDKKFGKMIKTVLSHKKNNKY